MRVLIVTNLYPNSRQPHRATFNHRQFSALAQDHDVQIIAPIAWTGRWKASTRLNVPVPAASDHRISDGIVIHHPCYLYTPRVLRGWYGHFLARSIRGCFRDAVRSFRPDVVLGSWAYPDGWAAVRLAREAGLPVAIKVHGSDLLTAHEHFGGSARQRRTVEALKGADAVITVSGHLRRRALAMGLDPSRVRVVYNGIDQERFSPAAREPARQRLGLEHADPLILFVGNLVPVKGLEVLMEALGSRERTGLRFRCVCVGSGPIKDELLRRVSALGIESRVSLIGPRPQDELPDWYRAADLVVLPSRSEGVPNVLLEAAACGTPCVATRVGGIPEVVHPSALVPPGDPVALADRIRTFLDPATRPEASPPFRPGSWRDSAGALATVLQGILPGASCDTRLAG